MQRLLLAVAYRPGSGLTNVLEGLATALRSRFDLDLLGFRTGEAEDGDALLAGQKIRVLRSTPIVYAANPAWLRSYLEETGPAGILVSGPGYMAWAFMRQLQTYRAQGKVALYMPLEGTLAGELHGPVIEQADACLLYTDDARKGMEALCGRLAAADPDFRGPLLATVGHGFDSTRFQPLRVRRRDEGGERRRRAEARALLFPDRPELHDAFIVLNANRQSRRKRLDLSLAAFAAFAEGKDDVFLLLHVGPRQSEQDWQIRMEIAEAGLEGRVLLSPDGPERLLASDRLNLIYNACDVGLSTSAGEGWGLGIFEHASTRAALVVPDHTSFRENWAGAALLVPIASSEFYAPEGCDIHYIDPDAAAAALERLYRDPSLRLELAARAQRRALHPRHRWTSVAGRIADILVPLLRGADGRPSAPRSG